MEWLGAIMIVLSCGSFGFSMAASHFAQERAIHSLITALEFMESELRYKLTPLPELCQSAGNAVKGQVGAVFRALSAHLTEQVSSNVASCMELALMGDSIDGYVRKHLLALGETLGRFDLEGQLRGLEAVKGDCQRTLDELSQNRESRLRSYQTLGLCVGAALAILLI